MGRSMKSIYRSPAAAQILYPVTLQLVGNNSEGMIKVVTEGPQEEKKKVKPNITIQPEAALIQWLKQITESG